MELMWKAWARRLATHDRVNLALGMHIAGDCTNGIANCTKLDV